MNVNKRIGERVKAARKAAGYSIPQFCARLIDVKGLASPKGVALKERGAGIWTADQIMAVCGLFGLDPAALFAE